MQVDKLFGTSKIVGKILNQYQIDYVMNLKKKNGEVLCNVLTPRDLVCRNQNMTSWFEVMYDLLGFFLKLLCFCPKALKTNRERIPVIQT